MFTFSSSALDLFLLFFYLQGENWKQFLYFSLYFSRALLIDLVPASMQLVLRFIYTNKHILQKTETKHEWKFFNENFKSSVKFSPLFCFLFHPMFWVQLAADAALAKVQQMHKRKAWSMSTMWDHVGLSLVKRFRYFS